MVVHKAELACPKMGMPARVTGTVVVKVLIDTNGNVVNPKVVSGPLMLQKAVLEAVRDYKYKPYTLNSKAVEAVTTISVAVDTYRDCPVH